MEEMTDRKRILLSGYYGYHNRGDDTLLQTIVDEYGRDYRLTVLSRCPEETARKYGVEAISRFHLLKIRRQMKKTDLLLSGGGSLLQDRTSTHSLLYYLLLIHMAERRKVPVYIYANGVGPIAGKLGRRLTGRLLSKAAAITLRDESSARQLREMGVSAGMKVTADPAFRISACPETETDALLFRTGVPTGQRLLGVSLRRVSDCEAAVIAAALDRLCEETGALALFLPMQPEEDCPAAEAVRARMKVPGLLLGEDTAPEAMIGLIRRMDVLLTMRYHGGIFAACAGTPSVGIGSDPKLTELYHTLALPILPKVPLGEGSALDQALRTALQDPARTQGRLLRLTQEQSVRAKENADLLRALLPCPPRTDAPRIAIFASNLQVGGIQKSLMNLLGSPALKGCRVELHLFSGDTFYDVRELPEQVEIFCHRPLPFVTKLMPFRLLFPVLHPAPVRGWYDAAIDFDSYQHATALGALQADAGRKLMWIHNDMEIKLREEPRYRVLFYGMRGKYRRYTHFAAVSEGIIPAFCRVSGIPKEMVTAVPNLIDSGEIRRKALLPAPVTVDPACFNLASVGRLCHQKGYDLLLDELAPVFEKRPELRLYLIGDGPSRRKLEAQCRRLGISGRAIFLGNRENPFCLLKQMDAFVLNSRYEGQGMVLWEAKALGLPLFFPRRLEKYNPALTGTDDLAAAILAARRQEKQPDDLENYNQAILASLRELLGLA